MHHLEVNRTFHVDSDDFFQSLFLYSIFLGENRVVVRLDELGMSYERDVVEPDCVHCERCCLMFKLDLLDGFRTTCGKQMPEHKQGALSDLYCSR